MEDKLIKEHSFYKYADEVAAICEPLFVQTPVNYFGQARIYFNHDYGGLISDKNWAYFYLKNDFQLLGIEPQLASLEQNPVFWNLNDFKPTCEKSQKYVDAHILFQHACGVMFITEYQEYKEVFIFSTPHQSPYTDPYLIENINVLKKFILYFQEKLYKNKKLNVGLEKKHHNIIPAAGILDIQHKPQVDFDIKKYFFTESFPNISFSKREAECLKYISQNKSAKEVGHLLNLSQRTIETHINNIKNKTNNKNLTELLIKLQKCSFLDAL